MANNIHELAQEAFDSGSYQLAVELFEHLLRHSNGVNVADCGGYPPKRPMISIDTYIGYADALARCGRIRDSFDVFASISSQLSYTIPAHRLKHLSIGLLASIRSTAAWSIRQPSPQPQPMHDRLQRTQALCAQDQPAERRKYYRRVSREWLPHRTRPGVDKVDKGEVDRRQVKQECADDDRAAMGRMDGIADRLRIFGTAEAVVAGDTPFSGCGFESAVFVEQRLLCGGDVMPTSSAANDLDGLLCAVCDHVLIYPVTMSCGHTFCRDCVHNKTQCQVCNKYFVRHDESLKQDVLISRLVEKWWMPHIQAEIVNAKTETLLRQNALDEALKLCNESLEKCEYAQAYIFIMYTTYTYLAR